MDGIIGIVVVGVRTTILGCIPTGGIMTPGTPVITDVEAGMIPGGDMAVMEDIMVMDTVTVAIMVMAEAGGIMAVDMEALGTMLSPETDIHFPTINGILFPM